MRILLNACFCFLLFSLSLKAGTAPLDENQLLANELNKFAAQFEKHKPIRIEKRIYNQARKKLGAEFFLEADRLTRLSREDKLTSYISVINECNFYSSAVKKKLTGFFDELMMDFAFVTELKKNEVGTIILNKLRCFPIDPNLTAVESNQLKMAQLSLINNMEHIINYVFKNYYTGKKFTLEDAVCSLVGQILIIAICATSLFIGAAVLCGINCGYFGAMVGFVTGTLIVRGCRYNNKRGHRPNH
jgi:hypothetical protein